MERPGRNLSDNVEQQRELCQVGKPCKVGGLQRGDAVLFQVHVHNADRQPTRDFNQIQSNAVNLFGFEIATDIFGRVPANQERGRRECDKNGQEGHHSPPSPFDYAHVATMVRAHCPAV